MSSFKQAEGFFKATHCIYLVGRILGLSGFSYSYGPSKQVCVRPRDVIFPIGILCAHIWTFCYYLFGGTLLSGAFNLQHHLFGKVMDFVNMCSPIGMIALSLYQFMFRKKYWSLLVEIDSIDFEVSALDLDFQPRPFKNPLILLSQQSFNHLELRSITVECSTLQFFC